MTKSKSKPDPVTLDDFVAKLGLITYRLNITDATIDRLGREFNSIRLDNKNIQINTKTKKPRIKPEVQKRLTEITFETEILFHSLVVNLYSFYEVLDQLPEDNSTLNKINDCMSPCLRSLRQKQKMVELWRNWVTAHGKLWGKEILGPLDITNRPQKFQKTIYLLTKYACMYGSVISDNFIIERTRGNRKIRSKWKTEATLESKDYFQQLRRAKKVRDVVKENLKKKKLTAQPRFVKSD